MSSDWYATTLGEICKFTAGSAFKPEHQGGTSGQYPFIKVSDMNLSGNEIFIRHANNFVSSELKDGMNAKEHPAGATVFAKIGVALQSNRRRLLVKPTIIDNNMMSATPKTGKVSSRFLYFVLSTLDFNTISAGSALPYLNVSDLQKMSVRIPRDAKVQQAIENVLGAIDDRISLLRETNTTLEAIAQALFKSWFVDFDPVHAKMQGRAPEGMDEATAALFPDSFEESELGAVPKGWATISFRDSITVIGGGTPKTSVAEYWGGDIPWFSVVDAPSASDVFVVDTEKHITEAGLNGSSTKLLPVGTTIISARGTVGRLALTGCPMAMNQSCYGLRGKAGDQYFTYFSTTRLVEQLKQRAHGSVFDTITQVTFAGVSISYPTIEVIQTFEQLVEPLLMRIRENLIQANLLTSLRDTLLPRLISGQLRMPEAKTIIDAA